MPVHVTVQFNLTAHLEEETAGVCNLCEALLLFTALVLSFFFFFSGTHDSLSLCRPNCCPAPSGTQTHR